MEIIVYTGGVVSSTHVKSIARFIIQIILTLIPSAFYAATITTLFGIPFGVIRLGALMIDSSRSGTLFRRCELSFLQAASGDSMAAIDSRIRRFKIYSHWPENKNSFIGFTFWVAASKVCSFNHQIS